MIRLPSFILAFALALPVAASAQDDVRARARDSFAQGVQRYEAHEYQGALEAFEEAYRLSPHPTVRVNMANCYERLQRPVEALNHFELFLQEAQGASRPQRREVEAAIRRLRGRIGEVTLSVAPDGAQVTIDGTEAGSGVPIRLSVGSHQVEVRREGFRTGHREIQVQAGQTQRLAIELERAPPAVAVTPPTPPTPVAPEPTPEPIEPTPAPRPVAHTPPHPTPPPESGGFQLRLTLPVIIAGSAMIGFTLAAIISGSVAVAANNDFENAVVRSNDPAVSPVERNQARDQGLSAADRANTSSIVCDVFIIGAIAAAGVTTFFVIVDGMNGGEEVASTHAHLRAAPSIGRNGGGLMLAGSF
jgi:hypothetical protein